MERVFQRKIYQQLLEWKENEKGHTAILVEGARRVGKSTIVEQFAKNEYISYILIDFNKATKRVKSLFDDLMDLNRIFVTLQNLYGVQLFERQSVIIFDEVQNCPLARQAIKYLVQDGRYDYIETGSLISIHKNVKDITIPSEEDRITMYPMDYEEFRWAMGDMASIPLMKEQLDKRMSLGDDLARMKMRDLRLYMLVGGMPQAVNTYLDTNNLRAVDKTKRGIIKLYLDDFQKIDSTGNAERLFKNIPAQLSRNSSRYQPYSVIGQQTETKMAELLQDLEQSKTVLFCYNCTDPNVGMSATKDLGRYKMFLADTGLFVTLCFWDKAYTENVIYDKLLNDKLDANLGYVYENLVAQMLASAGNNLFYHVWQKDEKHYYEVDFLLSRGNKLCPIEVKSSGYKSHTSLDAFCKKYSKYVGNRYLVYTKGLRKDGEMLMVPVYMTELL
ncbi:MAG: ATP-binding protein [Paludibacteraceae bacterium]|nr:ATP-binding protein [Paludibacteraceae bacterium]